MESKDTRLEIFARVTLLNSSYLFRWFDFSNLYDFISPPPRKTRTQKWFVNDIRYNPEHFFMYKGNISCNHNLEYKKKYQKHHLKILLGDGIYILPFGKKTDTIIWCNMTIYKYFSTIRPLKRKIITVTFIA